MGLLSSSRSTTQNENNDAIFNNTGDGSPLNLANLETGGDLNLNYSPSDHGAIRAALDFAGNSQSANNRALQQSAELAQAGIKAAQPAQTMNELIIKGVLILGGLWATVYGIKVVKK